MRHAIIALFLLIFYTASLYSAPMVSNPPDPVGFASRCAVGEIPKTDANKIWQCSADAGAASGAPTASTYILKTADGTLPNSFPLASLPTALLLNTTTTGTPTAYAGASCTNQVIEDLTGAGVPNCISVTNAHIANATITDAKIAVVNLDGLAATPSLRTLGTGAQQAAGGADTRFPTVGEKQALAGAAGTPSTTNRYITENYFAGVMHGPGVAANTGSFYLTNVTSSDDGLLVAQIGRAALIKSVWCNYEGSAPTTIATFVLRNGAGTAMTHGVPVCASPTLAATPQTITAGGALAAREPWKIDVSNTPNPDATQTYQISFTFEVTD